MNTILATNIKVKPAQQSREKERRVKVPAQETHATSYSAILDFLWRFWNYKYLNPAHTQKKHIASSAESDWTVINCKRPPNVWKDHNHLSTKKTFKRHCATDQESQLMYKVTPWISKDFDLVQAILVGVLCNWSQHLALYVVSNRSQSDKT